MKGRQTPFTRKKIIINKPFQLMIIGHFTFLALCTLLPISWLSYERTNQIKFMAEQTGASSIPEFKIYLDSLNSIIMLETIAIILASLGVFFFISLYLSHRMAGPIHRLKMVLKESGETKILKEFHLRNSDHFKDIEGSWNQFVKDYSDKKE